jgi:DNA invertase Pin-like site-specific DNA recombinase
MANTEQTGKRIGYKRVSTTDQNTARQLDGIAVDEIFEDKASGKDTARPQLGAAIKFCRKGDVFIVHSMDRLARNLQDLLSVVEDLNGKGVVVEFVMERLTFSGDDSALSKMLLGIMGSVAQFERSIILERQREGIAIAKAHGKYTGRKEKFDTDTARVIKSRIESGEHISDLAREYACSRPTIYRVSR